MNLSQMRDRCSQAERVDIGMIKERQLYFTGRGVPSIRPHPSSVVWEVLFNIDDECERSLDGYEHYPQLYRKENLTVLLEKGPIRAFVYVSNDPGEGKAGERYFNTLVEGAEENSLPEGYIQELKSRYAERTG